MKWTSAKKGNKPPSMEGAIMEECFEDIGLSDDRQWRNQLLRGPLTRRRRRRTVRSEDYLQVSPSSGVL